MTECLSDPCTSNVPSGDAGQTISPRRKKHNAKFQGAQRAIEQSTFRRVGDVAASEASILRRPERPAFCTYHHGMPYVPRGTNKSRSKRPTGKFVPLETCVLLVTITMRNIAVLLISDSKRREVRWFVSVTVRVLRAHKGRG